MIPPSPALTLETEPAPFIVKVLVLPLLVSSNWTLPLISIGLSAGLFDPFGPFLERFPAKRAVRLFDSLVMVR